MFGCSGESMGHGVDIVWIKFVDQRCIEDFADYSAGSKNILNNNDLMNTSSQLPNRHKAKIPIVIINLLLTLCPL